MEHNQSTQTQITEPVSPNLQQPIPVKSNNVLIPILAILILILLGVSGYLGYNYFTLKNQLNTETPPAVLRKIEPSPTPDPTVSWKTYTDEIQGFSFKYPDTWTIDTTRTNAEFNSFITLTREKGKITIIANMDGVGGQGRDFQGESINMSGISLYEYNITNSYDKSRSYGLTNSLTNSLGLFQYKNKTYSITLNYPIAYDQTEKGVEFTNEFNNLLSTFNFIDVKITSTDTNTPTPIQLDGSYIDKDFGYSISYPKSWQFNRTYGPDIAKAGTTDIVSGIEIDNTSTYNQLISIVVNVLDSHNETDINRWIEKYDLNYPKNAQKETITHTGIPAVNYIYKNTPDRTNEALYFISGKYTYRIYTAEKATELSSLTRRVINSFKP